MKIQVGFWNKAIHILMHKKSTIDTETRENPFSHVPSVDFLLQFIGYANILLSHLICTRHSYYYWLNHHGNMWHNFNIKLDLKGEQFFNASYLN